MSGQPFFRNNFLTKLGFPCKKPRNLRKHGFARQLRFERCEDRRMLATITVNSFLDNGDGANTTFREAIEQANASFDPDTIQFDPSVYGQNIVLTGSNLSVTRRVTITGPTGANRITIQKGLNSPATVGLQFSGFDLSPTGLIGLTGVSGLRFSGFDTGIKLTNLSSDGWDVERSLRIENTEIQNVTTGIELDNADVPFDIHGNMIRGLGTGTGDGIKIFNSGQFLPGGGTITHPSLYTSNIGNFDVVGTSNTINGFQRGIEVLASYYPDLRISNNVIGSQALPNSGDGIISADLHAAAPNTLGIGRIDNNSVRYNAEHGINTLFTDATIIENNSIAFNGHAGVSLKNGANDFLVQLNTFDSNGWDAIVLDSSADDRNKFSQNTFIGINLAANYLPINLQATANEIGQTPNDGNDFDPGANDLMNYPVINASGITLNGANWSVPFAFDTDVSGDYTLEFYKYTVATNRYDFIDSEDVNGVTSGTNDFLGTALIPSSLLAPGNQLSVLAIRDTGTNAKNTSEMAPVVTVPAISPAPTSITLHPSSDTGTQGDNRTSRDNSIPANNLQFTVGGTVSNATVRIYSGTTLIGTGVATGFTTSVTTSGTFDLADGLRTITAKQTLSGASESAGVSLNLTIDTLGTRINDVILANPTWAMGANPFSFASIVQSGQQLKPIFRQNVNTIQIQFNENVLKRDANGVFSNINSGIADGNLLLELRQTVRGSNGSVTNGTVSATGFTYNPSTFLATWTFANLSDGKYAIHLKSAAPLVAGIVDSAGNALDADWTNDTAGTPDTILGDPTKNFATNLGNGSAGTQGNIFRFHFALLAGDYDGDGVVEHGSESAPTGDGNGDGVVNSADNTINTLGAKLPLRSVGGADFNDDEVVDGVDLTIWQTGYGNNIEGDVDGDGDTDGADFLLWQRVFGSYSAWTDPPFTSTAAAYAAALGLTLEQLTVGLPPQILNVIISGSTSTHAPFSFDTVDGSGLQIRTVPVGFADTISIVFSENVAVSANNLIVVGLTTANVPQLAEFIYDSLTYTATWRFEGWALGDNYLLHLSDSITDADGNFLDGEWTNPASITTTNSLVSEFPSGDGISGGAFSFVMTLLPGDANLDGIVNSSDSMIWTQNAYRGQGTKLFTQGDFDGDGSVTTSDVYLLYQTFGTDLRTTSILSDLDSDGDVDVVDLAIIELNYGMTNADWADGDLNDDNIVNDLDLDLAFAQFGLWLNVVA